MTHHHDPRAEAEVIASVIAENACISEIGDLSAGDFHHRHHALVWECIVALDTRNEPIDLVSIGAELRARKVLDAVGEERLLALTETIPAVEHVEATAAIVRRLATVRAMVAAADAIRADAQRAITDVDAFLDKAESRIHAVAEGRRSDTQMRSMHDVMVEVVEELQARAVAAKSGGVVGTSTGLTDLDKFLCGLKGGELVVLGARPGMGKSALAGKIARAVAGAVGPAYVASLEMPRLQWGERLLTADARVPGDRMRGGTLAEDHWRRVATEAKTLSALPLYIDQTPSMTLWQIRSAARRLKAKLGGLALIVVDYIQLMTAPEYGGKRELEVSHNSRGLKSLAKELNVPVLALAQLNRELERRPDKRPQLSDLRESGAIEQDADVVLFIYRESQYDESADKTLAEIIVSKQRGGATGIVQAHFDPTMIFWSDRGRRDDNGRSVFAPNPEEDYAAFND